MFWGLTLIRVARLFIARAAALSNIAPLPSATWCQNGQIDFSIFWSAGRLAATHNYTTLYDHAAFAAWRAHHLCAVADPVDWIYLPPALLPSALIAYFTPQTGLLIWAAICILASALVLRLADLSGAVITLGLISPAALHGAELCQVSTITGALLVAGLFMAPKKPAYAGILISLLTFKPQEGLLAPIALAAQHNFRAILVAASGVMGLIALTTTLFGWQVWEIYWDLGRKVAAATLAGSQQGYQYVGVSVFWMARSAGATLPVAYAVQATSAILSAILAWVIWRRPGLTPTDRVAITVFLSLLATPYGFTDDMAAFSIMLACLAEQRRWKVDTLDVIFWSWPLFCAIITINIGILLTPFIIAAAIARTWLRAERAATLTTTKPAPPPVADA